MQSNSRDIAAFNCLIGKNDMEVDIESGSSILRLRGESLRLETALSSRDTSVSDVHTILCSDKSTPIESLRTETNRTSQCVRHPVP